MVTRNSSIRHLDDDTVLVTVTEVASPSEGGTELENALQEAETYGKPALVVDLSAAGDPDPGLLRALSACQRRCIANGRWILIVPPYPSGAVVPQKD